MKKYNTRSYKNTRTSTIYGVIVPAYDSFVGIGLRLKDFL